MASQITTRLEVCSHSCYMLRVPLLATRHCQRTHPLSATIGNQALPMNSHSVNAAVSRAAWRHILDDYPGVKSVWIWVDAGQVGTLEKALAVAAMMVVVVMRR